MNTKQETNGNAFAATVEINVTDIVPDPNNRKEHDKTQLQLLAAEIELDGLLQPVVVRPLEGGKFQLIAGERRWRAFQLLGRDTIPATVREGEVQKTATRKRVAENYHRLDLTPIEKARDLEQLFKDGMSQPEVAAFVGAKDPSTISNMMRLLKLPKKVQDWLQDGSLTAAHGKALLRFEGKNKLIEAIAERAIDQGASTKALEKGLPFASELAEDGIVFDFDWTCGAIAELPEKWRKDPDFLEAENDYQEIGLYCLDPKKGKLVSDEIEKAKAEREAARRGSGAAGVASGPGMTAGQLAERKKLIEKNLKARLETAAMGHRVAARLAKVATFGQAAVAVVAAEVIGASGDCDEVAEQLGLKLPANFDGYDPISIATLKPVDAIRLAAGCIASRQTEEAMRYAKPPPEDVLALAESGPKEAATVVETWKTKVRLLTLTAKFKAADIQRELGIPEFLVTNLMRQVKREQKATAAEVATPQKAKETKPVKKAKPRAVVTDETYAAVKKQVYAGKTGTEIAKALGLSLPTVQNMKKRLGLVRAKGGAK